MEVWITEVILYTIWRKCLTGENFDEFDKSELHCQNFPINILHLTKAPLLVIFMAHVRVHTEQNSCIN